MDEYRIDPTIAYDVVELPTKGIYYKNKKKSVKVAYLTAADENILSSQNLINTGKVIEELLKRKVLDKDLSVDEIVEEDRQAILIFLRNTAFGPEYSFKISDPETGKEFESTILLDELHIKECKVTPNEDGTFTTVLPKSNLKVKLKPLSFGESEELDKMGESYPKGRVAPKATWRLNKMIVEIEGNSDKNHISQNIDALPISDAKYIRRFIEENEPTLELTKKVIAPSGKETYVNIVFGVDFFRPFF